MIPVGFEYGFKKKLDVVKTQPLDWENKNYDLSPTIKNLNLMRNKYTIFNVESNIKLLNHPFQNEVLIYQKQDNTEKVLFILNKDLNLPQKIVIPDLIQFTESHDKSKFIDISLDRKLEKIPLTEFEYQLEPCEIKIIEIKN